MRTLVTDPLIPESLWSALAFLSAVMVVAYIFVRPPRISFARRLGVGALLALFCTGILGLLLNPTWEEFHHSEMGKPSVEVLVDFSQSMRTPDCGGKARCQAAVEAARALRDELESQFDVRFWRFDRELKPLAADAGITPDGIVTDLGSCLHHALLAAEGQETAVVLFSDGIHNLPDTLSEIQRSAQTARAMAIPIFARTFGADATVKDLKLIAATPDNVVFIDQEAPIRVRADTSGWQPPAPVEISLLSDGKVLERRSIRLGGASGVNVEFNVKPSGIGMHRYEVVAASLPEEVVLANNRAVVNLRVVDTPIRVMIIEGKPYWDLKFLTRQLSGIKGVRSESIVRMKDGRFIRRSMPEAEPGKPEPPEKVEILTGELGIFDSYEGLTHYDVIIIGRDMDTFLDRDAVENLCRWVGDWGGALVCARGRPLQVMPAALDRVMPVRWSSGVERRFRLEPDIESEWMGWFPSDAPMMPSVSSDAEALEAKPLASVIARSVSSESVAGAAVVTCQPYGAGRVVALEGAGLWRWAFLPPGADEQYKEIYGRFWNNLVRWLIASADFLPQETARLRPAQETFTDLSEVVVHLAVRNDPDVLPGSAPVISITRNDENKPVRRVNALPGLSTGTFRAATEPLSEGAYVARMERSRGSQATECCFEVTKPMAEQLDLLARPAMMKRLAEDTNGAVLPERNAGEKLAEVFTERWKERHPEQFRRTPAWDRSAVLVALCAVGAVLWLVRRLGGLI